MKVLLAEDDPVTRRVLSTLLRGWGYEVHAVADGEAAWAVLSGPDAPQLALLDWEMPGLEGIEVCRRVRRLAREPYTFVVLLTAREGRHELLAGLDAGADDYLTKPCDSAELAARLRVGTRITTLQNELVAAREALRHLALHDALTGVWNRLGVMDALRAELAALDRRGGALGLMMVDLDHFKRINDTWGHPAGDAVLRETAARLRSVLRPYDHVGRVGGEEFLLVLPDCDIHALRVTAERLRACVADTPVTLSDASVRVTCSIGIASTAVPDRADDLVRIVDSALYRAKNSGRNRVVEAETPIWAAPVGLPSEV